MSAKEYRSPEFKVTLKSLAGEVTGHLSTLTWSTPNADNVSHQVFWFEVTGIGPNAVPDAQQAMDNGTRLAVPATSIESMVPTNAPWNPDW